MAQVVLALADGATCLSDLAVLRNQPALAGPVASEPTVWRTFNSCRPGRASWPGRGTGGGPGTGLGRRCGPRR